MLQFMGENKRLLNIHEHNFDEIAAFQANTTVFQANKNDSLKNLEVQIRQLALTMQNQSKDFFSKLYKEEFKGLYGSSSKKWQGIGRKKKGK